MEHPIQRFENRFNAPAQGHQMHVPRRVLAIRALAEWKQAGHDVGAYGHTPLQWLRLEIGGAFQQLVVLSLPGAPAVEMLPATAEMWLLLMGDMDLDEEIDRPRIAKGFRLLYTHLRQWPQLVDLIANLPPRPQKAPPPPQRTEQQHADGAARLKDILENLGKETEETGHE